MELLATVPGLWALQLLAWHLSLNSTPCTGAELEGAYRGSGTFGMQSSSRVDGHGLSSTMWLLCSVVIDKTWELRWFKGDLNR